MKIFFIGAPFETTININRMKFLEHPHMHLTPRRRPRDMSSDFFSDIVAPIRKAPKRRRSLDNDDMEYIEESCLHFFMVQGELPREVAMIVADHLTFFDRFIMAVVQANRNNPSRVGRMIRFFEALECLNGHVPTPFGDIREPGFAKHELGHGYYVVAGNQVVQYLPQFLYCGDQCPPDHERHHIKWGIPYHDYYSTIDCHNTVYNNDVITHVFY